MSISNITSSTLHSLTSDNILLNSVTNNNNKIENNKFGLNGDKATFSEASLQTSLGINHKEKSSGSISDDGTTSLRTALGSNINVTQTIEKNDLGEDVKKYDFTYSRDVEDSTLTNADGTTTEVKGGTIEINETFTEDVQIVENKDGTTSVFFADSNKTHVYAADGSMTEVAGNALDSKSDKIIFNTTATSVSTGGDQSGHRGTSESWGHDTIISYVDDVDISTGYGNDTVYLMGKNQRVDLGEGTNSVIADEMFGGSISSHGNLNVKANLLDNVQMFSSNNDGYNKLDVDEINNSHLILSGANELNIGIAENSRFIIGGEYELDGKKYSPSHTVDGTFKNSSLSIIDNGDTNFNATFENSSLHMGDGNNTGRMNLLSSSSMSAGNGKNRFSLNIQDNSSVALGNGTNSLNLTMDDSALKLGSGNNFIGASNINNSDVTLGSGDNTFIMHDAMGDSSISMGDGNNTFSARSLSGNTKLSLGDGNNNVKIEAATNNASITMGDGNNKLLAYTLEGNAKVEAGEGDNSIQIYSMFEESALQLGNGDNSANVAVRSETSSIDAGNSKEKPFDAETIDYFRNSKNILSNYVNFLSGTNETSHTGISKFKLNT